MKRIYIKLFLLLTLTFLQSSPGDASAVFLLIAPGASAVGSGEAQVAKVNDAYATYYNPAGLAFQKGREYVGMHVNWLPGLGFDDIYYEFIGYRQHIPWLGTIGGNVIFLNLGEQTGRDETGMPTENWNSYMYALTASYGAKINRNSGWGANFKIIHQKLADHATAAEEGTGKPYSTDFAFDIGYLYRIKRDLIYNENVIESYREIAFENQLVKNFLYDVVESARLTFDSENMVYSNFQDSIFKEKTLLNIEIINNAIETSINKIDYNDRTIQGNRMYDSDEPYIDRFNKIRDLDESFVDIGNEIWDSPEDFTDSNDNGIWDEGEEFQDFNDNGVWDEGEQFKDNNKNGIWDEGEPFKDVGNGIWDEDEEFIDECNNRYDEGEPFLDNGNNIRDVGEIFTDSNDNGIWDAAEEFTDSNDNGVWDEGESFKDVGNGVWNKGEEFTDSNGNGIWDAAEEYKDLNCNYRWDKHEEFIDIGNGIWDKGEDFKDSNGNNIWDKGEEFIDVGNGRWDLAEEFVDLGNGQWDAAEQYEDSPFLAPIGIDIERHYVILDKLIQIKSKLKDIYNIINEFQESADDFDAKIDELLSFFDTIENDPVIIENQFYGDIIKKTNSMDNDNFNNDKFRFGLSISNIGPEVDFIDKDQADPLPTNMKMGIYANVYKDEVRRLNLLFDVNKMLVARYEQMDWDGDGIIDGSGNDDIMHKEEGFADPWYKALFTSWLDDWYLGGDRNIPNVDTGDTGVNPNGNIDVNVNGDEIIGGYRYIEFDGVPGPTSPEEMSATLLIDTDNDGQFDPDDGDEFYDFNDPSYGIYNSNGEVEKGTGDARTFSNELEEMIFSMGLEFWYTDNFAIRMGYLHDEEGSLKHPTLGAGIRFGQYGFDFGYILGNKGEPRENTLLFSVNMLLD